MWWLDVDSKYFLALIVFICNLIPVIGVLLATVSMAVGAVMQPDGSVWLALQITLATIAIHGLMSAFVSPRIVGKWFQLHPVLALVILVVSEHFFGVWGLILGVPVAVYVFRVVILDIGIPGIPRAPDPPGERAADR